MIAVKIAERVGKRKDSEREIKVLLEEDRFVYEVRNGEESVLVLRAIRRERRASFNEVMVGCSPVGSGGARVSGLSKTVTLNSEG